ncbi:hypothetical protein CP532_1214, partial [Ophiocordyceps camponoti-leonardi (nom. inval.)]
NSLPRHKFAPQVKYWHAWSYPFYTWSRPLFSPLQAANEKAAVSLNEEEEVPIKYKGPACPSIPKNERRRNNNAGKEKVVGKEKKKPDINKTKRPQQPAVTSALTWIYLDFAEKKIHSPLTPCPSVTRRFGERPARHPGRQTKHIYLSYALFHALASIALLIRVKCRVARSEVQLCARTPKPVARIYILAASRLVRATSYVHTYSLHLRLVVDAVCPCASGSAFTENHGLPHVRGWRI